MMKSIRSQLLIPIFAVVLPALAIIIYSNYERQHHDMEMVKAGALVMVQGLANDHEKDIEATSKFLMILARLPAIQTRDAAACNKLFRELLQDNNQYATIYAVDRDGKMFANAFSFSSISIKQRKYFQDAVQTKTFSAGEYTIGQITRRAVLPFAYPVMDSSGQVTGVVAVALDLEKYGKSFMKISHFPKGSTLNLLDRNYTRLYRYPYNEKYVGKPELPQIVKQLSTSAQEGVFSTVGVDGVKRLFAYKQFLLQNSSSPYLYIRIGIPEEQALAPAKKSFLRNLALVIVSLIAAILAAWLLGHILIVRRLDHLINASMKVGQGDFTTRTGIENTKGELGQLARSFDEMAQSLEKKELDRRQAVEALLESETKFKSYAEQALVGVYLLQDGVFKYVNPKFAQMFGYTVEECLENMPFKNLVYTEDIANVTEQIGKRTAGETDLIHYIFRGVKKNGQIVDVEIYGSSSIYEGRLAAAGTILDITERKQMEAVIREDKEKYQSILENIQEGYFEVDLKGNFTFCNDSMARLTGRTREELIGMNHKQFTNKETADKVFQEFNKVYMTGEPSRGFDWLIIRKDQTQGYIEASVTLKKDSSGKPIGFEGMVRDVTERKQTEEQIRHLATHDVLTDLPTMRLAKDRLKMAISSAERNKTMMAVMFIDLDDFKEVNDTLGHDAGDYVLKQVADRLLSCVRASDTVARVGGDEFLVIANGIHVPENAEQIAKKLINIVSQPIHFNGGQAVVGSSIGIALCPNDGQDMDHLIKQADEAMYRTKNAGKNSFSFASTGIK
ncbi:MAG: diguanylate cyclase [Smithella sp.]|jgi:diguanylate cyclase (GGDEF)-like protein/PAS domain S-box-containing protein|nr:diguanylate cyclase [Smithella sp.]